MELSARQRKIRDKQQQASAAAKADPATYTTHNPFRTQERNFKSRAPPPDFSRVFDFNDIERNAPDVRKEIVEVELAHDIGQLCSFFGQEDRSRRKAYLVKSVPGLVVIPNPFTPDAQRTLIRECLCTWSRPPNTSNLDTHYKIPTQGIWNLFEREWNGTVSPTDNEYLVGLKAHNPVPNGNGYVDDFTSKPPPPPSSTIPQLPPHQLIRKLRWVTLGYQYHWTTKTYHLEKGQLPMPDLVRDISRAIVTSCEGVGMTVTDTVDAPPHPSAPKTWHYTNPHPEKAPYTPQAGVINYYQMRDSLMAHVDKSEAWMGGALVSISLGNTAIFLMGGKTRDTPPIAMYLRSGDTVVMTGEARDCFHGVPRILEDTCPEYLLTDESDWQIIRDYIRHSRINLNVRQVFP
ncbi:hypothetical protein BZG36_01040 [Bifiguratus adelaidae]|uniref:Fe2OG dioxygenase domain-containing protein n=1 Tax=Bifiguratus adelaidae TaxID=1938954 RepID=A0A261Y6C9_9FUNG|nr:hypothetical protein BZG36_01040 [Bifiguratus adelaidae]